VLANLTLLHADSTLFLIAAPSPPAHAELTYKRSVTNWQQKRRRQLQLDFHPSVGAPNIEVSRRTLVNIGL